MPPVTVHWSDYRRLGHASAGHDRRTGAADSGHRTDDRNAAGGGGGGAGAVPRRLRRGCGAAAATDRRLRRGRGGRGGRRRWQAALSRAAATTRSSSARRGSSARAAEAKASASFPEQRWADYQLPAQMLTRSPGHQRDWIRACKGGAPACSNFSIAGPYTEWVVLGAVAAQFPGGSCCGIPRRWNSPTRKKRISSSSPPTGRAGKSSCKDEGRTCTEAWILVAKTFWE